MNSLPAKDPAEWASIADNEATRELEETLQTYLQATKPAAVSEYLTDKGFEEELQSKLGYCEKKKALVIPAVTGEYSTNIIGFIYRSVKKTEIGYSVTDEYRKEILIGDPGYVSQQDEDLIIVHDPLDLYRLRKGIDIKADGVSRKFSVAISNNQISKEQADRLAELKPRSIVYISGEDKAARELEDAIRAFCATELIQLEVVTLNAKDVCEYLKRDGDESLNEKINKATSVTISDRLLAWLVKQPPALKTGYKAIDDHAGIPVGAMTIVAGRPGHGKTTFLYNVMMQMVDSDLYDGQKFYFFSCEERGLRIRQKMLSRILENDNICFERIAKSHRLPTPKSQEDLIQKYALRRQKDPDFRISEIELALEKLSSRYGSIWVEDEMTTVEKLDKTIRKLKEREAIGAIFIDYIQRIGAEKTVSSIRESINYVSDVLRRCAVDTGLPLIIGAQISRKGAERGSEKGAENKRPAQADLKESGNLEEDANLVLGVFNETQAQIDNGNRNDKKQEVHTIEVYTMKSRDSEPFETKFVMTNRLFRKPEQGEV